MHFKLTQKKNFSSYLPLFQPGTSELPTLDSNEQLLWLVLSGAAWKKASRKQTDLPLELRAIEPALKSNSSLIYANAFTKTNYIGFMQKDKAFNVKCEH